MVNQITFDRKIYGEAITLAVGQGLAVIGVLVGIRVLTTLLQPAVYGQVALAITISTLITSAAGGPVGQTAGRMYAPSVERGQLRLLFQATSRFFGEIHLVVGAVALIAMVWVASFSLFVWIGLGILVVATSVVGGANIVLDCFQNAARQRVFVAWHQACGQWGRTVFAVLFLWLWGPTSRNVLWGYLVAAVLVFASQTRIFNSTLSRLTASEVTDISTQPLLHEIRVYGLPFAAWGAIAWLQQNSDRWLLVAFTDVKQVGVYQILYQLGYYPLALLSGLIGQVLGPILFSRAGDGNESARLHPVRRLVKRLGALILVGSFAVTFVAWLCHRLVFALLVPPEYRGVSHYLPLVVLASGLFATGQVLAFDALVQMHSKALMAPKIACALLATALNCIGAKVAGLEGVVYANVISSAAYAAWVFALTLKPACRVHSSAAEQALVH